MGDFFIFEKAIQCNLLPIDRGLCVCLFMDRTVLGFAVCPSPGHFTSSDCGTKQLPFVQNLGVIGEPCVGCAQSALENIEVDGSLHVQCGSCRLVQPFLFTCDHPECKVQIHSMCIRAYSAEQLAHCDGHRFCSLEHAQAAVTFSEVHIYGRGEEESRFQLYNVQFSMHQTVAYVREQLALHTVGHEGNFEISLQDTRRLGQQMKIAPHHYTLARCLQVYGPFPHRVIVVTHDEIQEQNANFITSDRQSPTAAAAAAGAVVGYPRPQNNNSSRAVFLDWLSARGLPARWANEHNNLGMILSKGYTLPEQYAIGIMISNAEKQQLLAMGMDSSVISPETKRSQWFLAVVYCGSDKNMQLSIADSIDPAMKGSHSLERQSGDFIMSVFHAYESYGCLPPLDDVVVGSKKKKREKKQKQKKKPLPSPLPAGGEAMEEELSGKRVKLKQAWISRVKSWLKEQGLTEKQYANVSKMKYADSRKWVSLPKSQLLGANQPLYVLGKLGDEVQCVKEWGVRAFNFRTVPDEDVLCPFPIHYKGDEFHVWLLKFHTSDAKDQFMNWVQDEQRIHGLGVPVPPPPLDWPLEISP